MQAFHPNGQQVVGTAETVPGRAEIVADSFVRQADGTAEFDWEGETEIFWDGQQTDERDGERIFLTHEGEECKESELVYKETTE